VVPCRAPRAATAPRHARDARGNQLHAGKEVEAESTSVLVHAASPHPTGLLLPSGTATAAPAHLAPGRGAAHPCWRDTEAPRAGRPPQLDSPDSLDSASRGGIAGLSCGRAGLGEDAGTAGMVQPRGPRTSASWRPPERGSDHMSPGQCGSGAAPTHRGHRQELHKVAGEEPSPVPALPVPPALDLRPLRARRASAAGSSPGVPRPHAPHLAEDPHHISAPQRQLVRQLRGAVEEGPAELRLLLCVGRAGRGSPGRGAQLLAAPLGTPSPPAWEGVGDSPSSGSRMGAGHCTAGPGSACGRGEPQRHEGPGSELGPGTSPGSPRAPRPPRPPQHSPPPTFSSAAAMGLGICSGAGSRPPPDAGGGLGAHGSSEMPVRGSGCGCHAVG